MTNRECISLVAGLAYCAAAVWLLATDKTGLRLWMLAGFGTAASAQEIIEEIKGDQS